MFSPFLFNAHCPREGSPAVLAATITLGLLAGCSSGDTAPIEVSSREAIASVRVSEVSVSSETPRPNPRLEATLKQTLESTMTRCARGTIDHRLEVIVVDFEDQDVGKTILIGDEIELEGRARLVRLADETRTGEFYVSASFFWGGVLGAALMSNAEKRLSEDFAARLCKDVFGVEIKASG